MFKNLIVILLIGFGLYYWWPESSIHYDPGIIVDGVPSQRSVKDREPFTLRGYTVTPLASFSMDARVLSKSWYRFAEDADIVPFDLALGWGPMSDESVLEEMDISQSDRKYFWHTDDLPLTRKQIVFYSANMHMIPADPAVLDTLKEIRKGSIISLSGYLVKLNAPDGRVWKTSLTRTDTGANSCELIYVEELSVH